ncbi:MAG: TonB-dependent receptor family protein, partial [Nitrospira sp.]
MWVHRYSSQIQFILLSAFLLAVTLGVPQTFAQEVGAGTVVEKSARERDLRDQLQNILRELEEIQQQPAGGAVVTPVQPAQSA